MAGPSRQPAVLKLNVDTSSRKGTSRSSFDTADLTCKPCRLRSCSIYAGIISFARPGTPFLPNSCESQSWSWSNSIVDTSGHTVGHSASSSFSSSTSSSYSSSCCCCTWKHARRPLLKRKNFFISNLVSEFFSKAFALFSNGLHISQSLTMTVGSQWEKTHNFSLAWLQSYILQTRIFGGQINPPHSDNERLWNMSTTLNSEKRLKWGCEIERLSLKTKWGNHRTDNVAVEQPTDAYC